MLANVVINPKKGRKVCVIRNWNQRSSFDLTSEELLAQSPRGNRDV